MTRAEAAALHVLTQALWAEFEPPASKGTLNSVYEAWRDNRAAPLIKRLKRRGWRLTRTPHKRVPLEEKL